MRARIVAAVGPYSAFPRSSVEAAGYDVLRREQDTARKAGRCVGIGLSCFLDLTGPGAVTVLTGVTDQGQGMRTALAQIVADDLGGAMEAITVISGDTARVPYGGGTWGSRGKPTGP